MAYTKTVWVNGETALSDTNMNHIEDGIKDAHDAIATANEAIEDLGDGLSNVYTKDEVIPKSEQYGNTFGNVITIPRTLSNNNGTASFNYTFPADGYLYIDNQANVASLGSMVLYSLTLNGQAFTRPLYYPSSGASSFNIKDEFIFVKKGMVLGGQLTLLDGYTEKIKTFFIPFEPYE